jgi:hypothetical protein
VACVLNNTDLSGVSIHCLPYEIVLLVIWIMDYVEGER